MRKHRQPRNHRIIAFIIFGISIFLLFFFTRSFILEVSLFIFCLIFMVRFGQFFILDVDPVPFSAILLLYLNDYRTAFHFLLLTLPVVDVLSSRLNHYSLINFVSVSAVILIFGLTPLKPLALYLGIIVFDAVRSIINLALGLGPQTLMYNLVHASVYFGLGSVIGFFI